MRRERPAVTRRAPLAGAAALALVMAAGCSTAADPSRVGGFVDDAAITSTVKTRLVENRTVDPDAIQVETRNGNVVLSGHARNRAREEHRREHRHEGASA